MFNRPGVTYESAQTRKYQLGRTEVIRSASNESKAWAEAMLSPDETVSTVPLTERPCILKYTQQGSHRAALFKKAAARHVQYSVWATDGQGVDRHLFGLKKMLA